MIGASSEKGFLAAHWEWLVAGAGLLALAGAVAFAVLQFAEDPETLAADAKARLVRTQREKTGVEEVDLQGPFAFAAKVLQTPATVSVPPETLASFLASECRVFCEQGDDTEHTSCHKPMPFDLKVCPFCQTRQPEEKKLNNGDTDADGIPDEWEMEHGMDPNDGADANLDADGDGFTNLEEFLANPQTDPQDPASHPDYLDSVQVKPELKKDVLPFFFESVSPIPNGHRFYFKDPKKKNDYGRMGRSYSVLMDKEIGDKENHTGFFVTGYEKKERRVVIKGGAGKPGEKKMEKIEDISEVEITRKADGKVVRLVINKPGVAIDTLATLVYTRGEPKEFVVGKGSEIDLNGTKYTVILVEEGPSKAARVTLKNTVTGKSKRLDALEQ